MVKFKKHIIAYGDTIQSIAQKTLGDFNRWTELAQFNDLRYPYIVDTVEEKMKNPEHLRTTGDTLLVRASNDEQSELISSLKRMNEFDQEEIYALALGKDLDIMPFPKQFGDPGWDNETLELKGNEKGQLATVRGVENLIQALYIRLITPLGSYVGHPKFGSNIHKYLGKKNTEENATLLNLEIERTLRTDGRVTRVELVNYVIKGNTYAAHFKVTSVTIEEAFDFVVSANQNGIIVLENDIANIANL